MLKNLKVRTKLIAVLAVPLLALVAMAGIGVRDRRSEAADARQSRRLVDLSTTRVQLEHDLQLERMWTAASLSGSRTTGTSNVPDRRARTDQSVAAFTATATGVRSAYPELADELDRVAQDLGQLATTRTTLDSDSANVQVTLGYYSQTAIGLTDLAAASARAARRSELQGDLASLSALASLKEAQSTINTTITQITIDGQARDAQIEMITSAQAQFDEQEQRFLESASETARQQYQSLDLAPESQQVDTLTKRVVSAGVGRSVGVDSTQWLIVSTSRLGALFAAEDQLTTSVGARATGIENDAENAARNFAYGASVAVLVSLLLASLTARSITGPLRKLTNSAYELSEQRLPALVEQLRHPERDDVGAGLAPIEVRSRDEIGQLANAFNAIQLVTRQVAAEQSTLLRKGIGDIFINLARRNQTLLDRQIEFIDQLEAHEEDPDQLEDLFKLDHLATRMRRNAESLLVLAGAEPARRRGRPVDMADVVRVAIGEVEHFARITLLALDEATLSGNVAVDLAHLLSELMENATQFSPPETQVEIVGHRTRDGNYVISVSDQGIGMSSEQLTEANRLLANPPVVGLALSRSLGFTVIGRLAARFGIVVRLTSSPVSGVSALVTLPAKLVDAEVPADARPEVAPAAEAVPPVEPLFAPPAAPAEPTATPGVFAAPPLPPPVVPPAPVVPAAPVVPPTPIPAAPAPEVPAAAAPPATPPLATRQPNHMGLPPVSEPARPLLTPPPPPPSTLPPAPPPLPTRKPQPVAMPLPDSPVTAAGLTRRIPKPAAAPTVSSTAPVSASSRSPEEVRLMLSRYRSGLRRGRTDDESDNPDNTQGGH
jgi:signal transduction histidine kinase